VTHAWVLRGVSRTAVVVSVTASSVTGCVSEGSCASDGLFGLSPAAASCAAGIEYQGHFYVAWSPRLPVAKGSLLGDAVHPACGDGSGCGPAGEPGPPTHVWALPGADPDRVLVGRVEGSHQLTVYGRLHVDAEDYFRFAHDRWHLIKSAPEG
jgi:hypothetical protein